MNLRFTAHLLGWLFILFGSFMLLPIVATLYYGESHVPFLASAAICGAVGGLIVLLTRTADRRIRPRDRFLIVAGAWVVVSTLGGLPYLISGELGFADSIFEAASGITTTGSTVLSDIEGWPRGLHLWRAFTQWLGGMGIIVFTIAILPLLGIGGMQLFKAEVPGPTADKVRPRVAATARALWGIYVGFTLLETVLLMFGGMSLFEAVCHSLTTISTGGFSTRNASVAGFESAYIEWVIILFMFLGGVNFVLHYRLLLGRDLRVFKDEELRYYVGLVFGSAVLITIGLIAGGAIDEGAFRTALFQTLALLTTTGSATADFEVWPTAIQALILGLLVVGGMAGSTSGGVKGLRIILSIRSLQTTLWRLIHPHAVRPVKYGRHVVNDATLLGIWGFLTAYLLIMAAQAIFLGALGYDVVTAFSASLTAIGNVGPGLGEVGPFDNFAHFPAAAKLVLAATMVLGRLEIFTFLVFLSPEFWRR